jgi:replication factor C subunit 1
MKIRTLANYCLDIRFRKPDPAKLADDLRPILRNEGLGNVDSTVVRQVVAATQCDIRQILNIFAMMGLTQNSATYDQAKDM